MRDRHEIAPMSDRLLVGHGRWWRGEGDFGGGTL